MSQPEHALLTGANGVFGLHIAAGLAARGYLTHCVVRSAAKGEALLSQLASKGAPAALLQVHVCDLTDAASIAALPSQLPSLSILVNNAAFTSPTRQEAQSGVELQWATNVLAYQRLMRACLPLLQASSGRAVFVASSYAGGLNVSDPEFKAPGSYCGDSAYRASKQANRMLGRAWAGRYPAVGVYSCHPGVATSAVSLGLGFDLDRSEAAAAGGARTPLFLALSPKEGLESGGYYSDCAVKACKFSQDAGECQRLWELVESYD